MGELYEAKKTLIDFESICRITENNTFYDQEIKILKDGYPNLFSH